MLLIHSLALLIYPSSKALIDILTTPLINMNSAHIGVGIRGVEGYKASMNSDYSISQFQDLRKLILYHGRECYRRNTQLIFYNFYKNILLVMAQFW